MSSSEEAGFQGDTSRDALRAQYASLRRLTPPQRWALMDDLTQLVQSMTRAGLKRRHPELSDAELEAKYFEIVLGRDLAASVLEHRRSRPARPST
jgi:hypothetical protein